MTWQALSTWPYHLAPVERARVAACRQSERSALSEGGHLADAAWREVNLRGTTTLSALGTLRGVAAGALRSLDITGGDT